MRRYLQRRALVFRIYGNFCFVALKKLWQIFPFFFFFFFKLNVPGSVRSGKRRRAFPLAIIFFFSFFFFLLKRAGEGVITGKGLCTTCFASSKDCSEQSEHGVRSSMYPL